MIKYLEQKRLFDSVHIEFNHDSFTYKVKDRTGSRTFSGKYMDLNPGSRYEIQEKNEYFRNVGFLWLAIAIFDLVTTSGLSTVLWGGLGSICLAIYYFAATRYIVIPSTQGPLYVIDNAEAPEILNEFLERYKKEVLEEYGEVDYSKTFEEEKQKYRTFLRQGVINESSFNETLRSMEEDRDKFKSRES